MQERYFKDNTTYPFSCMVFALCRFAGARVWNIDAIKTPPGQVDIGIIRDEANELDPQRGPRIDFQSLGENLAATIE